MSVLTTCMNSCNACMPVKERETERKREKETGAVGNNDNFLEIPRVDRKDRKMASVAKDMKILQETEKKDEGRERVEAKGKQKKKLLQLKNLFNRNIFLQLFFTFNLLQFSVDGCCSTSVLPGQVTSQTCHLYIPSLSEARFMVQSAAMCSALQTVSPDHLANGPKKKSSKWAQEGH